MAKVECSGQIGWLARMRSLLLFLPSVVEFLSLENKGSAMDGLNLLIGEEGEGKILTRSG